MDKDAQHNYLEFLKGQVEEKHNRLIQERTMNNSVEPARIRTDSPELSPSPAYLGVLPYSHDRKRQLEVLDRNFGFSVPRTGK